MTSNWEEKHNISGIIRYYLIYDHDTKIPRFNKDGSPVYLYNSQGYPYLDENGNKIQKRSAAVQFKEMLTLGILLSF